MKVLYIGGQKSGKSHLAEQKCLSLANIKPFYVATYDNSYCDSSMQERIKRHVNDRQEQFITIEQTCDLAKVIKPQQTYIIDCISMWLFNNLHLEEAVLKEQLTAICKVDANIVFVLNDVNCGVIPFDKESRRFVDFSGLIGQHLVQLCDEVMEVRYGIEVQLK